MALIVALATAGQPQHRVDAILTETLAAARAQGHQRRRKLQWNGGQAWWFDTPANPGSAGACVVQGERFAALVGTAHWRGRSGESLLRHILNGPQSPSALPWMEFSGAFALLWGDRGQAWLLGDAVGLQKIYSTPEAGLFSTSLMACRQVVTAPRLNRLRAHEYVLLGAHHGHASPVREIVLIDPSKALNLVTGEQAPLHRPQAWRSAQAPRTFDAAVELCTQRLVQDTTSLLQAFGGNVGMALSGGFDSRLLLAMLDHAGVQPALFVYGPPGDEDVEIAQAKARSLGMPIECIDKDRLNAACAPIDRERVERNLRFFDGLPTDGVLDRGADRDTRLLQMAGGRLNLNGGGGEVLRNFFYIQDRPFTADDIVGTFYSNWVPEAVADPQDRQALREALGRGVLAELGFDGEDPARLRLARTDVELIYTLIRLRYWMGRNNSIAALHGHFMTPLCQPELATLAARVPLRWKTYGQLESAIIQRLSPRVAAGPSSYGFSFDQGPGLAHKLHMMGTLWRPVALRRASTALRFRLGRAPAFRAPEEWLAACPAAAVDGLRPEFLTQEGQVNRLLTLCAFLDDKSSKAPVDSATVSGWVDLPDS